MLLGKVAGDMRSFFPASIAALFCILGASSYSILSATQGPESPPSAPPPVGAGTQPGEPAFEISKLDRVPRATVQGPPSYPFELRRQGIEGFAIVDFIVDRQGTPRLAHAIATNVPAFGYSAVMAVARWRFSPGEKAGKPVNTHMVVPIVFSLGHPPPRADILGKLIGICARISSDWLKIHGADAFHKWVTLPDKHPTATVLIEFDSNGQLSCESADPSQGEPVSFVYKDLAAHPVSPEVVNFIRATPGFSIVLPSFAADTAPPGR